MGVWPSSHDSKEQQLRVALFSRNRPVADALLDDVTLCVTSDHLFEAIERDWDETVVATLLRRANDDVKCAAAATAILREKTKLLELILQSVAVEHLRSSSLHMLLPVLCAACDVDAVKVMLKFKLVCQTDHRAIRCALCCAIQGKKNSDVMLMLLLPNHTRCHAPLLRHVAAGPSVEVLTLYNGPWSPAAHAMQPPEGRRRIRLLHWVLQRRLTEHDLRHVCCMVELR
jgi:hypothetical protein